jgi:hypothetical protein
MWLVIGTALGLLTALGPDAHFAKERPDPHRRIMILMNESDRFGPIGYERERRGEADQPSHLTPERVHGGVGK